MATTPFARVDQEVRTCKTNTPHPARHKRATQQQHHLSFKLDTPCQSSCPCARTALCWKERSGDFQARVRGRHSTTVGARTPLEHAAASGNLNLVHGLLKAGANELEGWKACRGRTLLDAAALGGNADVMCALLQAGCGPDVNVVAASTGRSALYQSIVGKNEAAARRPVLFGADVNFEHRADKAGPLIAAVKAGYDDLVRDLLIAGADPNTRQSDCFEGTPLHAAAERGLASTVSVLLSSPKTDKNALNNAGQSPLTMASYSGRVAPLTTLLAAGADIHKWGASDAVAALSLTLELG